MSIESRSVRRSAMVVALGVLLALAIGPARALVPPTFDTAINNPGSSSYYSGSSLVAFVATPVVEVPYTGCTTSGDPRRGQYYIGTDVLTATSPSPGNALYLYLPASTNRQPVKLFPLQRHLTLGLVDGPIDNGSVVEPSLSEDGTRLYFSYFQDATDANSVTQSDGTKIPRAGADIYVIDLKPAIQNPATFNPTLLGVRRLTTRVYAVPGVVGDQAASDRDKDAMNITLAGNGDNFTKYGTVYLHPTEYRTIDGLKLAYVSSVRRLANADLRMTTSNYNLNLHAVDISVDASNLPVLGRANNEVLYYTTTSVLSPTPLREGLAFSYQATTEDARNWQIQRIDSEGRWGPLLGFGSNPELYHLGSFCVGQDTQGVKTDYYIATRYYNQNNAGFGALWRQNLAQLGTNTYNNPFGPDFLLPRQVGSELVSLNVNSNDYPSTYFGGGVHGYEGKFTSPRCGSVNELYFAYTPTSANGKNCDSQGSRDIYHAYIGRRGSLAPWDPRAPLGGSTGHQIVVDALPDSGGHELYTLAWPVPVLPWVKRSAGDAQQRVSTSRSVTNQVHILPGEPISQIGSASLTNTDRRPYECWLQQPSSGPPKWYSQWGDHYGVDATNFADLINKNQDAWTVTPTAGPSAFCSPPDPNSVLGVQINITSNKADRHETNFPYTTENGGYDGKELKRVLGVYDVRSQSDKSFRALIPANTPFELQLLDKNYGMKLTDVRSWHSLQPREVRANCGGCHQHNSGSPPTPWAGTYASTHAPVDFVRNTSRLKYDANCKPTFVATAPTASQPTPEWRADIWPSMDTYCGSCHRTGGAGAAALSWAAPPSANENQVYIDLIERGFASSIRGALGSQAFMAATGARTDNRSNSAHPANYDNHAPTCESQGFTPGTVDYAHCRMGFYYSNAHNIFATRCSTGDAAYADWLFKLGKWIDHGMPRDKTIGSSQSDWFHPTADVALTSANCSPTAGRVGFYDETGTVASIKVRHKGATLSTQLYSGTSVPNGTATFTIGVASQPGDVLETEVIDAAGNRQIYRKRIDTLQAECALPVVPDPLPITP